MTSSLDKAFSSVKIGPLELANRIAMAPLTRQVALPDGTPTDEMVAYYARRARGGVGLIISEGIYPKDEYGAAAYLSQPGIASKKHVTGWKKVCSAVHEHNAAIIIQLMHGGRVTDPRCLHEGESPVSASALQSDGFVLYTDSDEEKNIRGIDGDWPQVNFPVARELSIKEIEAIADGFAEGAVRSVEAGADGVEVHGANGYLIYQFIHPKTNKRTDLYGGTAVNNVRFANLVCEKVRDAIGPEKLISLRLSQDGVDDFMGAWPEGVAYARAIGEALRESAADVLHWSSFDWTDNRDTTSDSPMPKVLRQASGKPVIVNGGITEGSDVEQVLESGAGDICAVGRPLFAHPDWPHIIRSGAPYNWTEFDRTYVVAPAVDHAYAYPVNREPPSWTPDVNSRRKADWAGQT